MNLLALLLLVPSVLALPRSENAPPTHLTSSELLEAQATLTKAPLFHTFKPVATISTPYGWLNDPGPVMHMPNGDYHVWYQWSPYTTEHGGTNESWGHTVSKNFIDFYPGTPGPYAVPNLANAPSKVGKDKVGVYTGFGFLVKDPKNNCQPQPDRLQALYTGANEIPIHWDIAPYPYNHETLVWAETFDNGKTWVKHVDDPILPGPPVQLDYGYPRHLNKTARMSRVTGFRDPSVFQWEKLADYLGVTDTTYFGLICGGIHNVGPGCYLHSLATKECDQADITKWNYIGLLPHVGINATFGEADPAGILGANFEMGSLVHNLKREYVDGTPAPADGTDKDLAYIVLGVEGGAPYIEESGTRHTAASRWLAVNPSLPQVGAKGVNTTTADRTLLSTIASGPVDLGNLYALNHFYDEATQMQTQMGWSNDDSLTVSQRAAVGWTGSLSTPTEMYEQVARNVKRSLFPGAVADSGLVVPTTKQGEYSQLAHRPQPHVWAGIQSRAQAHSSLAKTEISSSDRKEVAANVGGTVLFHTTFNFGQELPSKVGIVIEHKNAGSTAPEELRREPVGTAKQTTIEFDFAKSYLLVNRSQSHFSLSLPKEMTKGWNATYLASESKPFDATPDGGPMMLYEYPSGWEHLELKVLLDRSMLQVFANGRQTLTTRIYPATNSHSLTAFVEGASAHVRGEVWDQIPQLVHV